MILRIALLLSLLLFASPCRAGDGTTPVIVFYAGHTVGDAILWIKNSNIQPPDVCYEFVPTNNDSIPSHYTNTGSGYSYTPPAPPPPSPNVGGFINAVTSDTSINTTAQMALAQWYPQLQMFIGQPALVQTGWSNLVSQYSSSWLTSDIQSAVLAHAAQFNIPLTP